MPCADDSNRLFAVNGLLLKARGDDSSHVQLAVNNTGQLNSFRLQSHQAAAANTDQHKPAEARAHPLFSLSTCKSLYIGSLHIQITEIAFQSMLSHMGLQVQDVKIVRDKASGLSAGYGFAEFADHSSAEAAMKRLTEEVWYGQQIKVNWAFGKDEREDTSEHHHIFVGDLCSSTTDARLFEAFQQCEQCSNARVMRDHTTHRSLGYGFVSFRTLQAAEVAIMQMHGELVGPRRVRCAQARHKPIDHSISHATINLSGPDSCSVYVGNIAKEVTKAQLQEAFEPCGSIADVRLYKTGAYGFVRLERRDDAIRAVVLMNGKMLNDKALVCSLARSQSQKPKQAEILQMPSLLDQSPNQAVVLQVPPLLYQRQTQSEVLQMSSLTNPHCDQAEVLQMPSPPYHHPAPRPLHMHVGEHTDAGVPAGMYNMQLAHLLKLKALQALQAQQQMLPLVPLQHMAPITQQPRESFWHRQQKVTAIQQPYTRLASTAVHGYMR